MLTEGIGMICRSTPVVVTSSMKTGAAELSDTEDEPEPTRTSSSELELMTRPLGGTVRLGVPATEGKRTVAISKRRCRGDRESAHQRG
jgi:hypothetical protein